MTGPPVVYSEPCGECQEPVGLHELDADRYFSLPVLFRAGLIHSSCYEYSAGDADRSVEDLVNP